MTLFQAFAFCMLLFVGPFVTVELALHKRARLDADRRAARQAGER